MTVPAALPVAGPVRAATEPPEAHGTRRDGVRLLVAARWGVRHTLFRHLGEFLRPGDLVVVNTSATLPAAVDGRRGSAPVTVHFSTALEDGTWAVELRRGRRATGPVRDADAGDVVELPAGRLSLVEPFRADARTHRPRLWRARVVVADSVPTYLSAHGRPIAYDYVPGDWPLESYQTVFAREPGSAEMPSAGRPFSTRVVTDLVGAGVVMAPVTLHTGVSSLEQGELPLPERFDVPATTARLVNATRQAGGRVVAVGTTVTRALESVAGDEGTVRGGSGWTDLVLGPDRPARVVDGLVTGWHQPGASHLLLLQAVAGPDLVRDAYAAAHSVGYRWHEFGDSALLLP